MKKNQKGELRSKKISELQNLLQKAEEELVKLRMDKVSGKTKDTTILRKKVEEITIVKTLIREKQQM